MGWGIVEVRRLTMGRVVTAVVVGVPLVATVSAVAQQPWQVAERAAIGVGCWGLVTAALTPLRPGRYTLRREPVERLAPKRSGLTLMAAEALFVGVIFVFFGAFEADQVANGGLAGLVGAWGLGIPLGAALAGLVELGVWGRMARREHGSLWVSASVLAGRQDRRTLFVIPDSKLNTIGG